MENNLFRDKLLLKLSIKFLKICTTNILLQVFIVVKVKSIKKITDYTFNIINIL